MANIKYVGDGEVHLLAGGGKVYTDIAARFVGSERDLKDIIASPYDKKIVENIINSGHLAATEFDYFVFGIQGYARVTEIQLVRKRIASYLIKSGRIDKYGKRNFDVVVPKNIDFNCFINFPGKNIILPNGETLPYDSVKLNINCKNILNIIEQWYNYGVNINIPEEDLRYMKPQATEFKAIIGMNVHSLLDWFKIRLCKNSQTEIRDLAMKMLRLCKKEKPDIFKKAGANCIVLGYCPENDRQNKKCKG
ncbi:MAG: FAD-dependent thymidylate synthase, partial [Clostridia bacterium]